MHIVVSVAAEFDSLMSPMVCALSSLHQPHKSAAQVFILLPHDVRNVPNQQQLMLHSTTLHDQIWEISSFNEHHYEDPYLVHVNPIHFRVLV